MEVSQSRGHRAVWNQRNRCGGGRKEDVAGKEQHNNTNRGTTNNNNMCIWIAKTIPIPKTIPALKLPSKRLRSLTRDFVEQNSVAWSSLWCRAFCGWEQFPPRVSYRSETDLMRYWNGSYKNMSQRAFRDQVWTWILNLNIYTEEHSTTCNMHQEEWFGPPDTNTLTKTCHVDQVLLSILVCVCVKQHCHVFMYWSSLRRS